MVTWPSAAGRAPGVWAEGSLPLSRHFLNSDTPFWVCNEIFLSPDFLQREEAGSECEAGGEGGSVSIAT